MPKRIVICSDGTGNTAIKGRGTNVFKVFEAVDLDSHRYDPSVTPQIAIYDDGVGTENLKPLKILSGATGWGLSRNVRHLYGELSRVYDPGDQVYMFGFSRGAFTVRTLVGLIATCGIVDPRRLNARSASEFERAVREAYAAYRKCYAPKWRRRRGDAFDAGRAFRDQRSHPNDVRVRFLGVWDTVDAVGLPFALAEVVNVTVHRFKFPDQRLSAIVDRACHALSIDDARQSFHPLMWNETAADSHRISQVWFAGAHSNVGGGYPKQGMSLVALDWMLEQAELAGKPFGEHGLRLNRGERVWFREHASGDDKLYEPRSGLGAFYRWKIRDIGSICARHNVQPKIHVSVMERIAHGTAGYAPGNLPSSAQVVFTAPPDGVDTSLAQSRAAGVQRVLALSPDRCLLPRARVPILLGQIAYWSQMAISVVAVLAVAHVPAHWLVVHPVAAARRLSEFSQNVVANPASALASMVNDACSMPMLSVSLLASAVTLGLVAHLADRRMTEVFSEHWYRTQDSLRSALKGARHDALRSSTALDS